MCSSLAPVRRFVSSCFRYPGREVSSVNVHNQSLEHQQGTITSAGTDSCLPGTPEYILGIYFGVLWRLRDCFFVPGTFGVAFAVAPAGFVSGWDV